MPTENDPNKSRRWIVPTALAAILLFGFWLRAANLGGPSFDIDEYLHVFAANALLDDGRALLPSGMVYNRALAHTWSVAASFALFGVSEATARIPSLIAGMLLVLVTFRVGRRWIGPGPALLAAALVAVFPAMVDLSRFCRMYAAFQVLYLGAAFAYESGFEREGLELPRRVGWAVAGFLMLLASAHMHPLTVVMIPAIAAYWVGLAALRWRSRYGLYLLTGFVAAAIGILAGIVDLSELWARTHEVSIWAEPSTGDFLFYVKEWNRWAPWVWWLALPATALLCWRRGRVGFFISCQFWVPFLLHSFVFAQKFPRYMAYLFPFLALIVAATLWEAVRWPSREMWSRAPSTAAVTTWAVLVLLAAAAFPSVTGSTALHDEGATARWRDAYAYLEARIGPSDALLVSVPLSARYHLPEQDAHAMNNFFLDPLFLESAEDDAPSIEIYSGLPSVGSLEDLQRVIEEHPRTWIAANWHHFHTTTATPWEMRRFIEGRCRRHWAVQDRSVVVFACSDPAGEQDGEPGGG